MTDPRGGPTFVDALAIVPSGRVTVPDEHATISVVAARMIDRGLTGICSLAGKQPLELRGPGPHGTYIEIDIDREVFGIRQAELHRLPLLRRFDE
jgi:hypothetical protein